MLFDLDVGEEYSVDSDGAGVRGRKRTRGSGDEDSDRAGDGKRGRKGGQRNRRGGVRSLSRVFLTGLSFLQVVPTRRARRRVARRSHVRADVSNVFQGVRRTIRARSAGNVFSQFFVSQLRIREFQHEAFAAVVTRASGV